MSTDVELSIGITTAFLLLVVATAHAVYRHDHPAPRHRLRRRVRRPAWLPDLHRIRLRRRP